MRKSDKKIDNQLRLVLTNVCELALKDIDGFQWLTHLVDYSNFPKSLKVVCVFDTNNNLERCLQSDNKDKLTMLIQTEFKNIGINVKNITKHICYDTEEDCTKYNNGNWAHRLN